MPIERWLLVAGLIFLGLILEFVEVFVPSFGLITTAGLAAFGGAVYLVYQGTGDLTPALVTGGVAVALLLIDVYVAFKLLPRSPLVLRSRQSATGPAGSADRLLVGKVAVARTLLRPSGKVELEGVTRDAESADGLIEAGAKVRVVDVRLGRLVVRMARLQDVVQDRPEQFERPRQENGDSV